MKKTIAAALAAAAAMAATADPYGAPPDAKHAWSAHDDNRPPVAKISADGAKPPSDAKILFDGTKESIEKNWCDNNGRPTKWKLDEKGDLISVRGAGYICTREKFADCQLHVEWASPTTVSGFGQGRGNSGVFLPGDFEIQVLDSWETDASRTPNPNPNYSDGQAGAAYGQNPPLVNPCRAPGVFNTYDIIFHSPVYGKNGKIERPATATVLFNGVVVQDNWKFDGPTMYRNRASYPRNMPARLPIRLQDHGNPVHFRNIWVRELPPQGSNTTYGNWYAKPADVEAQREKNAVALEKEFDAKWGAALPGVKAVERRRIAACHPNPDRIARAEAAEKELLALLESAGTTRRNFGAKAGVSHGDMRHYYGNLRAAGAIAPDNAVLKKLDALK